MLFVITGAGSSQFLRGSGFGSGALQDHRGGAQDKMVSAQSVSAAPPAQQGAGPDISTEGLQAQPSGSPSSFFNPAAAAAAAAAGLVPAPQATSYSAPAPAPVDPRAAATREAAEAAGLVPGFLPVDLRPSGAPLAPVLAPVQAPLSAPALAPVPRPPAGGVPAQERCRSRWSCPWLSPS